MSVGRWGGPREAGVGGLTGDTRSLQERNRVWRGEYMVLSQQLGSGAVIVIVDAEVNDELMMRRGELGGKRVEPCERVRPLGATGVGIGGCCWA